MAQAHHGHFNVCDLITNQCLQICFPTACGYGKLWLKPDISKEITENNMCLEWSKTLSGIRSVFITAFDELPFYTTCSLQADSQG